MRIQGVLGLALVAAVLMASAPAETNSASDVAPIAARDCTPQEYQRHLAQLRQIIAECSRNASKANCDWHRAGLDDNVTFGAKKRLVSYAWLRSVLEQAATVPGKEARGATQRLGPNPALLGEADQRLKQEQERGASAEAPDYAAARSALSAILARREFQHRDRPNPLEKIREAVVGWLLKWLSRMTGYSDHAYWLTWVLLISAILAASVPLVWWFAVQKKRQRRLRPPASDSPSRGWMARDWRRYFEDAERLSGEGCWREAIQAVYWAAIVNLESRGVWSVDSARTPREYLSALRPGYSGRQDLASLTRRFELTWYGRQPADRQEYNQARALLERLAAQ